MQDTLTKTLYELGVLKGGPGSGHYGHAGRPGRVGGSLPAGFGDGGPASGGKTATMIRAIVERTEYEPLRAEDVQDGSIGRGWLMPDGRFAISRGDKHGTIAEEALRRAGLKPDYYTINETKLTSPIGGLMREGFVRIIFDEGNLNYEGPKHLTFEQARFVARLLDLRRPMKSVYIDFYTGDALNRERLRGDSARDELMDIVDRAYRTAGKERPLFDKGGPGSGHHGHAGRPGEVGGSLPGTISIDGPGMVTVHEDARAWADSLTGQQVAAIRRYQRLDEWTPELTQLAKDAPAVSGTFYRGEPMPRGFRADPDFAERLLRPGDTMVLSEPMALTPEFSTASEFGASTAIGYRVSLNRADSVLPVAALGASVQGGDFTFASHLLEREFTLAPGTEVHVRSVTVNHSRLPSSVASALGGLPSAPRVHWFDSGQLRRWLDAEPRIWVELEVGEISKGGPGSGHRGHAGRPGKVGGSAPGGSPLTMYHGTGKGFVKSILSNGLKRGSAWKGRKPSVYFTNTESAAQQYGEMLSSDAKGSFAVIEFRMPESAFGDAKRDDLDMSNLRHLLRGADAWRIEQDIPAEWIRKVTVYHKPEDALPGEYEVLDEIDVKERDVTMYAVALLEAEISKGGPGSGHHGHLGRPGKVGGSLPAGAGDGGPASGEVEGSRFESRVEGYMAGDAVLARHGERLNAGYGVAGVSDEERLVSQVAARRMLAHDLPNRSGNRDEDILHDLSDNENRKWMKEEISKEIAELTGESEETVSARLAGWAFGSSDEPISQLHQEAADIYFGNEVELSDWQDGDHEKLHAARVVFDNPEVRETAELWSTYNYLSGEMSLSEHTPFSVSEGYIEQRLAKLRERGAKIPKTAEEAAELTKEYGDATLKPFKDAGLDFHTDMKVQEAIDAANLFDRFGIDPNPRSSATQGFIKAVYQNTQSKLASAPQSIGYITLHRGMVLKTDSSFLDLVPEGEDIFNVPRLTLNGANSLSSWSTDFGTALEFANRVPSDYGGGVVLTMTVPVSRIFSTAISGPGCLNEQEFILLGRDGDEASARIESIY